MSTLERTKMHHRRHLKARCSRGISTRGSKTVWHLCLQLSLFVLCLTSLWATSLLLSPLAAPSIYHTGIELQRHTCRRLPPVPPPAWLLFFRGCTSESSRHCPGWLELGTFQLVSVGFRDPVTPCRRCILQQAFLSCMTAFFSVGVLLSVPVIVLAGLNWVRSSLSLLVLEVQGLHAGATYSNKLS